MARKLREKRIYVLPRNPKRRREEVKEKGSREKREGRKGGRKEGEEIREDNGS
jgi:hypothetical protein